MKSAKEITSNALVIVGKISSFLTLIQVAGFSRRLLEEEPAEPAWYVDGNPSWASHGDRRLLQTSATPQFTPNVTVAKDGSGDFTTISGALAKAPKKLLHGRYVIYVKEGVYEETVEVDKNTWNITMYGDGEQKTIVTGSKNFIDGVKTYHTATFAAIGDGFMAVDMAFLNTAGANKHQAVALRVQADRAIFLQCRMEAYQDTLTLSYAEYNNKGPGADTSKRVNWAGFKVISQEEASAYTVAPFIQGDDWISKMGAPVRLGLYNE
ncbi:pectinesterase [Musa troglodytarum]|uniref:Pectinesterase n=1 Tax=Musa troglodytarum TaxID=320322 RepID=A0A9E7HJI3_9LILI|nr:pectinesterase [Musa troglodytarum]